MAAIAYDNNLIPGTVNAWQIDQTLDFKQGQFVKFVTANKNIAPATAVADGALAVGVAQFTDPMESEPLGPNASRLEKGSVMETGRFRFKGKDGETYTPRLAVEIDPTPADGQSVRDNALGSNDPLNIVGYISTDTPEAGIAVDVTTERRFVEVDINMLGLAVAHQTR
jgi:hypothetical protein